ncbi:MAG: esterase [Ilumatobacteraceae bacterium]|nr:esterase [Ilumatobacteraceae bacterium]
MLNEANGEFLAQMAASGAKGIAESTPEEVRAMVAGMVELFGTGPEMARSEDHTITTDDGSTIAARVLVPSADPKGVLVYYHGGGWVIGALPEYETLGRKLADRTGCTVVLVDYRLAPEHRYPTAADDAYTALLWVQEHLESLAGPGAPLIVAGDSAGGNLAAVTAQRSRDEDGPPIAFQVLVYPVTDADFDNSTYSDPENQLILDRASMIWFWDHYAPDAARRREPKASPLRADDLSGLPPALVITAEHDVLRDEGEAYADRLREAGVPVEQMRYPGQMHGFFTLLMVPGHEDAIDQIAAAITSSQRTRSV